MKKYLALYACGHCLQVELSGSIEEIQHKLDWMSDNELCQSCKNIEIAKKLTKIGGNEWIKNEKHRIYFNLDFMVNAIKLDMSFYKTGNICSARIDGKNISNSEANRIINTLNNGKFYYDVVSGKFMSSISNTDYTSIIKKTCLDLITPPCKKNRSEIMRRAWEIARSGAARFGGSSKSFFAVSLRQAWAETKN